MRIVIDLQGAQTGSRHRGIGRYSLALAQAMVRNCDQNEIFIVLNGLFPETIEPIRAAFEGILPQENIRIWYAVGPINPINPENSWRRKSAELIREAFLESLSPDIVHITSLFDGFDDDAAHTIGLIPMRVPVAITFYDLIPLIQSEIYLKPTPKYEAFYREKLDYSKKADLYLAISESSRQEAVDYIGATKENSINISAAADSCFKPISISSFERLAICKRFGLVRPFLMYSGATDSRKNHLRLIKAFSILPSDIRNKYQLAIVGSLPDVHRKKFETYVELLGLESTDVIFTGRVTDEEMVTFYNLCDLFVFPSWHEGFGLPALEAMSCGAPVIGANTSSVPEVIGRDDALFDPFDEISISQKMAEVLTNDRLRFGLARHGLEQAKKFSWDASAKCAITAFERWHAKQSRKGNFFKISHTKSNSKSLLIEKIAKIDIPPDDEGEWLKIARSIAQNHKKSNEKQLLIDVSELVQRDSRTGIQRVVRSVLNELMTNPPPGFRVEPVYAVLNEPGYRYARAFSRIFTKSHSKSIALKDELLEFCSGDIFLGLDLQQGVVFQESEFYKHLKCIGVQVYFVVYDLLPVLMPEAFRERVPAVHMQWLGALAQADGILCISRAVADEVIEWLSVFGPKRLRPLKLGWFHLGADVAASIPSRRLPTDAGQVLNALSSRPTFLMVGTLEPRKGQMQALVAFERLWSQGQDVNLVMVGQLGWNVDLLIEILQSHSELNKRLFWLEGVSDEYLEKIYATSKCLIAASEGEGFGLPLIEAAQHKKPIIARDIPVFREVAGAHAFYFSGREPDALARAVHEWLALDEVNQAPQSDDMPWLTWRQCTENLLDVILNANWYQQWMPDDVHRFWGSDHRLGTQVGKRSGRVIASTGQVGYLVYGPYISLASGHYRVVLHGSLGPNGSAGARIDVAFDQGHHVLGASVIAECDGAGDGTLASLMISLDTACSDLEVRVWVGQMTTMQIAMIEITPWKSINGQSILELCK